jgi:carbamoyltransferase
MIPLFHGLLREFEKLTGCPVLLNTSFNDADEPIVCWPTDAVRTFLRTALDALVIGPFLVERK